MPRMAQGHPEPWLTGDVPSWSCVGMPIEPFRLPPRVLDRVRDGLRLRHHSRRTDIRTVQKLPGHRDVPTTMIYTHVLNRAPAGVRGPADRVVTDAAAALPGPATQPGYADRPRSIAPGRFRG